MRSSDCARPSSVAAGPRPGAPELEDAHQLVHFYAERGSPKYEKKAMRWLEPDLTESSRGLQHFAGITTTLTELGRT